MSKKLFLKPIKIVGFSLLVGFSVTTAITAEEAIHVASGGQQATIPTTQVAPPEESAAIPDNFWIETDRALLRLKASEETVLSNNQQRFRVQTGKIESQKPEINSFSDFKKDLIASAEGKKTSWKEKWGISENEVNPLIQKTQEMESSLEKMDQADIDEDILDLIVKNMERIEKESKPFDPTTNGSSS